VVLDMRHSGALEFEDIPHLLLHFMIVIVERDAHNENMICMHNGRAYIEYLYCKQIEASCTAYSVNSK